jgi:uncharacterized protein (UPF0333 family)
MKICNFDLIILVILMFIVNFFYDTIKKYFNVKEGFDATSDMKAVINQVYNADIEAIRNLSSIASQLQAGGLTVPGNLIASDVLGVSNNRPEGGQISIRNPKKTAKGQTNNWAIWNMTGAYGDKLSFWRYNGDGENAGPALDIYDNGTVRTGTITTGAITSDDWFRVKGPNGLFFQDFGGGWHMVDTTWIRAYNGKNVYCNQEIRGNRITTEANIVADGTITQKTHKFHQKIRADPHQYYRITHNLGLPLHLYTIKILASNGNQPNWPGGAANRWDITGQIVNYGFNQGYSIQELDNNCFHIWISPYAATIYYGGIKYAANSADYDIYII